DTTDTALCCVQIPAAAFTTDHIVCGHRHNVEDQLTGRRGTIAKLVVGDSSSNTFSLKVDNEAGETG
ncbi:hypothetical protein, partial [Corynebacterium sp. AOP12-C2-36]|uniref:hypothetical protein n=1 Tax=Corynebacterium sp. AOP12-C2-36 TaxID=3457723 RepID=UPI004034B9D5